MNITKYWRDDMKKALSIVSLVLILVLLAGVLVACAPANAEKGKAKLEKKGYFVEVVEGDEINDMLNQQTYVTLDFGAVSALNAAKGTDNIFVVWFKTKEKAENFASFMSFTFDVANGQIPGMDEIIYGAKGKVFYMGTEQAVKDFF
jgi:hypothetical protein